MKRIRLVPLTAALLLANPATPIFAADDSFTKEIAALPAEGQVLRVMVELKQMNPGFSSTETHNIESGKVTELTLSSCSDLSDISPVRALVHLQKFVLGRSRTTDISPLKGMRLTRLTLWANPVTDLAPIAGMPIEWLNCSSTKVQDLSPLKGMPINELYCDSTLVSDFSPLEGMPLRILRCDAETAKRNAKVLQSINTLQTINGQPAQEFLKAPGAGAVTIVRRPAPAVAPPVVVESEPDKWTVIFRSADPTMWNTEKAEGDNNFAIPLKKVQDRVQYLRLRRTDTKDSVIVKMDTDNGRRLGEIMDLGDYVWNGSCRLERLANPNAEARTNYQLGIAKKEWFVPYKGGVIVLSQSEREGCSGWGFAKSALLYSGQAYAWAGKGIGATVFEIAVTSEELLPDEQERLLSSRKPRKAAPPPVTLPLAAQPMMRGGPLPRNIEADYAFTDASKPYTLLGTHAVKKEAGHIRITVAPGVEIRNGEIYLDREGELIVNGSQEKPAILHGVTISQNLNGYGVKAKWAIFDQCQFVKKGGWFAYFSSKWSCDSCLFHKSSFAKLKGLDFGIKLTRCAFVKMSFPEIEHTRPKDKPFDHMRLLRTDWNTISGCQFVDCEVAPTVGWCAQESNFMGCKFPAGETFESDSPTEITAFVADTGGDWPHRSWEAYASPQTALKVVYAPAPFSTIAFPVLAQPAGNATQKIMEDGRLRAWLSSKTVAGGPGIAKQSFTVAQTKAPPAPPAGVAGRDKEKQKTTAEERKPVVATVADAEMQKNAKPLARNQSSIKGLYVVRTEAGLRVGGSQDIIATAERASSDRETICDFVTEVGKDTDISMDEAARLLKVRYPVWQAGYKIRFSYSNKYSKQGGGSAGGAFSVLLLSLLDGLQIDPAFAMTGDVTVDGKIREVGAVAEKIRGATLDKCRVIAIPEANKESLNDLVILYSPAMLWSAQILSITTLDDAAAVARVDRAANLAKAMELFGQVQRSLGASATPFALRSPGIVQTLQQVMQLAPNHLSAEFMLRSAGGRMPLTLSLGGSLEEIWAAAGPLLGFLFADNKEPEKSKRYYFEKVPTATFKAAMERLNWLQFRLHPKTQALKMAMADYMTSLDQMHRQSSFSAGALRQHLVKRDKVLSEAHLLGTDRKTLEEMMH